MRKSPGLSFQCDSTAACKTEQVGMLRDICTLKKDNVEGNVTDIWVFCAALFILFIIFSVICNRCISCLCHDASPSVCDGSALVHYS